MPYKHRRPSTTSAVIEVLETMDDFLTPRDIVELCGHSPSRVSAALHWLVECGAIAVVVQDGAVFYYRSVFTDKRQFTIDEVTEHSKPRRRSRITRVRSDEQRKQ